MGDIQAVVCQIIKTYGTNIIWIVILFFLARLILKKLVRKTIALTAERNEEDKVKFEQRTKTLGSIIITTGNVIIYLIILLMILNLFKINIGPILAGAGIVGLAVGFGAQSLVKDFVSGLFILLESQYSLGDKVKIGNFEGRVLRMTMRSTVLEDEEGKIFYVSNGSINNLINFSQKKSKK